MLENVLKKPNFLKEMLSYPNMEPILVSLDWDCLNYIRRLNGVSLLCTPYYQNYDLGICFNKETWVLYSQPQDVNQALSFARKIQLAGATKVAVLLIKLRVVSHDNNKDTDDHRVAIN